MAEEQPDPKKQRMSEQIGAARNTSANVLETERKKYLERRIEELEKMWEEPGVDQEAIAAEGLTASMELAKLRLNNSGIQGDSEEQTNEIRMESEESRVAREKAAQEKREIEEMEERRVAKEEVRLSILSGLASMVTMEAGRMGCTMSKYKEQSVAVIYLPIVEGFFKFQEEGIWMTVTEHDVRNFFGRNPGCTPDKALPEVKVDFRGVDFRGMILQTEYKAPSWKDVDKNMSMFFVTTEEKWNALVDKFRLPVGSQQTLTDFRIHHSLRPKKRRDQRRGDKNPAG